MNPNLPPERTGHLAPAALAAIRAGMKTGLEAGIWKTSSNPQRTELGGRPVLRFTPPGTPLGLVLHLHGGAFRIGIPEMTGPYAEALAQACAAEIILPEYRLAPEYPFPAGLNDAACCLRALAQEAGTRNLPLVLAGDSAGGCLAASLVILAGMEGLKIAGLVLLSPWLDLTVSAPSYTANKASDPLFSEASAAQAAELYLQGFDPRHPLASPIFAEFSTFPRTLINVGSGEVLLEDSKSFHAKLQSCGIHSQLRVVEGMEHTAPARNFALTGAQESFDQICRFVRESFGQ